MDSTLAELTGSMTPRYQLGFVCVMNMAAFLHIIVTWFPLGMVNSYNSFPSIIEGVV